MDWFIKYSFKFLSCNWCLLKMCLLVKVCDLHYLSSSFLSVSTENLYWKPEQPPPSTCILKYSPLSIISVSLCTEIICKSMRCLCYCWYITGFKNIYKPNLNTRLCEFNIIFSWTCCLLLLSWDVVVPHSAHERGHLRHPRYPHRPGCRKHRGGHA